MSATNRPEFSVAKFYQDGSYYYAKRWMTAEEALRVARRHSEMPSALMGIVRRIIITDGGDFTVFEWTHGKGITFPTEAESLGIDALNKRVRQRQQRADKIADKIDGYDRDDLGESPDY